MSIANILSINAADLWFHLRHWSKISRNLFSQNSARKIRVRRILARKKMISGSFIAIEVPVRGLHWSGFTPSSEHSPYAMTRPKLWALHFCHASLSRRGTDTIPCGVHRFNISPQRVFTKLVQETHQEMR